MILHEPLVLVGAGLVAALPSSRLIAAQLYGLQPTDPATACVDPMVALRAE